MQIITDSGTDLRLDPELRETLPIHVIPLTVTLDGRSYREGVDIDAEGFYRLLADTQTLPTTSQPSPGEFAELYRQIAADDPDIISVHISSGLSGTMNSALAGARLVPEANVSHIDTHTLSAASGWQVEAAARAARVGRSREEIISLAERVGAATNTLFTLEELRYLIHGGRISHLKGLLASLLNIKPVIGVDKTSGRYEQQGQARTFGRAVQGVVDAMARLHAPGSALRVQVMHAQNPEGAARLTELVSQRFECSWLPAASISPVLGAHTGPSLVGVAFAPLSSFADVP